MKTEPAAAADTAEKLASAIKQAEGEAERDEREAERDEREAERQRARGVVFESANAPKDPVVPPGLAAIVERVFIPDDELDRVYEYIHQNLKLGEKLTEHGHLVGALDRAEVVHRLAHRLYVTAKIERAGWERDSEVNFGALRAEATRVLQSEKAKGARSKQITDADVESTCAWMFPDEWRAHETKRGRLKATEDSLLNLVEVCASRCRTLQTLLGKHR